VNNEQLRENEAFRRKLAGRGSQDETHSSNWLQLCVHEAKDYSFKSIMMFIRIFVST